MERDGRTDGRTVLPYRYLTCIRRHALTRDKDA